MSPCFAGGEKVRLSGEAATGLKGNLVGRRRGLAHPAHGKRVVGRSLMSDLVYGGTGAHSVRNWEGAKEETAFDGT